MSMFVQGKDPAEKFSVSSNSRNFFFIKVDCTNYGDASPAHVKWDGFLLLDKPRICP